MNLAKKYPITTDGDILEEIAKDEGIPLSHIKHWYKIWISYIRHLADSTDQTSIHFPKLGIAYYLIPNDKASKRDKKIYENKKKDLETLKDIHPFDNGHLNRRIYQFYGVLRRKKNGKRWTKDELTQRQRKTFLKENNEETKNISMGYYKK